MKLLEEEIFQKNGLLCKHCGQNCLIPYEYGFTCFVCGYNLLKQKLELTKYKRKKIDQTIKIW